MIRRLDLGSGRRRCSGEAISARSATSLGLGVVCATVSILVGAPLAWFLARATTRMRASWLSLLNVGGELQRHRAGIRLHGLPGHIWHGHPRLAGGGVPLIPPSSASFVGLAIGYVYTNVPLFVLLTLPAMGVVQGDSMEAAAVWAASRLAVLALHRSPGAGAISCRRMAADLHLVDRHLRSGLRPGRQRRHEPAAADDAADRRLAQFGRGEPGAGGGDGDPAPADRHGLALAYRLAVRRAVQWVA